MTTRFDSSKAKYSILVQHSSDWKVGKYDDGRVYLSKGEETANELPAQWNVDIKTGRNGRTIAQLVEQLSASMLTQSGTTLLEKKVVKRADGTSAGILLYTRNVGGAVVTERQYFYALDENSVLAIREMGSGNHWKEEAETLNKITESAVAVVK